MTLDGKKAGLQRAADLKDEMESLRKRERDKFRRLDASVSGKISGYSGCEDHNLRVEHTVLQIYTRWSMWLDIFVRLTLIWYFPPSCPPTQPFLPISQQPNQNLAESEIVIIKPTQLYDLMDNLVY